VEYRVGGYRRDTAKAIARRITKLRSPLKTDIDLRSRLNQQTGNKEGGIDAVHCKGLEKYQTVRMYHYTEGWVRITIRCALLKERRQ
jgi:hypothetical protein